MSAAIEIVLAGLMVLVPNSSDDPSSLTAYLVSDRQHRPVLRVLGAVELDPDPKNLPHDPFACRRSSGPAAGFEGAESAEVSCDLVDAEIFIDPGLERRQRYLRPEPRRESPRPSERANLEWLLRMRNIEGGVGQFETFSEIRNLVAARFTFGWEDAKSCALDGSEDGQVRVIGFESASETSRLRQAVSESVLFSANLRPGPIVITLRNSSGFERIIRARCPHRFCLVMVIDNSIPPGSSRPHEQQHFSRYYELSRFDGERMVPYVVPAAEAEGGGDAKLIEPSLLECTLRLIRPIAPQLAKDIRDQFWVALDERRSIRRDELTDFLAKRFPQLLTVGMSRTGQKSDQRSIIDIILEPAQVQDRVICPPTIMEP